MLAKRFLLYEEAKRLPVKAAVLDRLAREGSRFR
jgi:hypothetical protein